MSVMLPSAELLSQWAAEELWDWRVRLLFAIVCAYAVVVVLAIYLLWGRGGDAASGDARARRYTGRVSVALFVMAAAEASFFKEPVSTALLVVTASIVGAIALNMPSGNAPQSEEIAEDDRAERPRAFDASGQIARGPEFAQTPR